LEEKETREEERVRKEGWRTIERGRKRMRRVGIRGR
jgi:hypothetical protein